MKKINLYFKRFFFIISKIKENLIVLFINPFYSIKVNSYIPNPENINFPVKIGYKTKLNLNTKIEKYVSINDECIVMNNVEKIGSYSSISDRCYIGIENHPMHFMSTHSGFYTNSWGFDFHNDDIDLKNKKTVIEEDVWIGYNARVLAGCTIGRGSIIAADAFVKTNVEPYTIWSGNPAKKVSTRFSKEQILFLENSKWWKKDLEEAKIFYEKFEKKIF